MSASTRPSNSSIRPRPTAIANGRRCCAFSTRATRATGIDPAHPLKAGREKLRNLSPDLDRSTVGQHPPNFFHFLIGDGDAAGGPIHPSLECTEPAEAVSDAMNHDIAAGIFPTCRGFRHIASFRIADVQG